MILKSKNITLDQFPDEQIDIQFSVLDIEEYAFRSTSLTKDFILPGTQLNNEFFNSLYQLDKVGSDFNPNTKIEATIEDDGKIMFRGWLQLLNIIKSNNGVNYSVQIIGNVKQLVDELEGLNLRDLDLSQYNHKRDLQTITNSWEYIIKKNGQFTNSYKEGYVYPQIVYNEKADFDSTYIFDYKPAVYVKSIIDSLFQTAGIEYTSKFFESDYFKSLIIPMSDDEFPIEEEDLKVRTSVIGVTPEYVPLSNSQFYNFPYWWYNRTLTAGDYRLGETTSFVQRVGLTNTTQQVLSDNQPLQFQDTNSNFFEDKFTAPAPGWYTVNVNLNVVPEYSSETPNAQFAAFKKGQARYRWWVAIRRANGQIQIIERNNQISQNNPYHTSILQPSTNALVSLPFKDINGVIKIIATNRDVFLNTGDQIIVGVGFRNEGLFWDTLPVSGVFLRAQLLLAKSVDGNASYISVKPKDNHLFGNEKINLNEILPNMSMLTFFQNIVRMFNLVIDEDKFNNRLIIEPYSDYYLSGEEKDWTEKHNIDEELIIELTTDVKEYKFSYQDDDDLVNNKYQDEFTDRIYGDFLLSTNNEFGTEVQEVNLDFAPTPTTNKMTGNRVQPYFVKDNGGLFESMDVKPRILFYGGLISATSYTMADNEIEQNLGSFFTKDKYPYAGIWDKPYNPINSLEFSFSNAVYYPSQEDLFPLFNLFNKFHQFSIKDKISDTYRRIEGEFYLTKKDISDLKLNDIIKYKNRKYRIIEITYQTTSTNELLSNVILESIGANDIYEPEKQIGLGVCPANTVNKWVNGVGVVLQTFDGQNVSADCCNSLGGEFRNGVCIVKGAGTISDKVIKTPIFDSNPQPPILDAWTRISIPGIELTNIAPPFQGDVRRVIEGIELRSIIAANENVNDTFFVYKSKPNEKRSILTPTDVINGGDTTTKMKASSCEHPRIINGNGFSKFLT